MKRATVFVSRYCLPLVGPLTGGMILIGGGVLILHGLIVRFWAMFSYPPALRYFSGILELALFLIPMMTGGCFIVLTGIEKTQRTAELLFSTPLSVREYMFSLWVCLLFSCIIVTPVVMAVFVLVAGVKHLANISLLIWMQILPAAITWVSAAGLLARILMIKSFLKKILYGFFIVFLPFLPSLLLTVEAMISGQREAMGIGFLPSSVLELLPIDLHWARWLAGVLYAPVCFFLLIRKIEVKSFLL